VDQIDNYGIWYWLLRAVGYDMNSRRFLREITTDGMKRFNDKVPDSLDVRYFSVNTRAKFGDGTLSLVLYMPQHWLEGRNHYLNARGNDGMVPFDSQTWGKVIFSSGELDHLAQMNHHEATFANEEQESLRVYEAIYNNLASEGF
jgi:triacylglycerol esterase/lipase EstA (alpha/beta hydrolase family)